jgi:hypothetical protein
VSSNVNNDRKVTADKSVHMDDVTDVDNELYAEMEKEVHDIIFNEDINEEGIDNFINKETLNSILESSYKEDKEKRYLINEMNTMNSTNNQNYNNKIDDTLSQRKTENNNNESESRHIKEQTIFSVMDTVIGFLIECGNKELYNRFSNKLIEKCEKHDVKYSFVNTNTTNSSNIENDTNLLFTKYVYTKRQISKMKRIFREPTQVKLMFENKHLIILLDPTNTRQYAYMKNEVRDMISDSKNSITNLHSYKRDFDDPYFAIDLVGIVKRMGNKSYTLCCRCGNVTEFNAGNTIQDTGLIHCSVHRMGTKSLSSIRNMSAQTEKNTIYDWKDIATELLVPKIQ